MDAFDYKVIIALYSFKNITNAANALYISQPAITERIKKLENELMVKLILSSNKGVKFTKAGLFFYEYASDAIIREAKFKERLININDEIAGSISIGAPSIVARFYLPSLIRNFNQQYPNVTFNIHIDNSSKVLANLKDELIDFGFVREDFGWVNGVKLQLTENFLYAVSTQPFTLDELPAMCYINYKTDMYFQTFLDKWWVENYDSKPTNSMQVSSIDLCKELVFTGVGYGILPSMVLIDHPEVYKIPLKNRDGSPVIRKTWLLSKNKNLEVTLNNTFYEFIKQNDFNSFLRQY